MTSAPDAGLGHAPMLDDESERASCPRLGRSTRHHSNYPARAGCRSCERDEYTNSQWMQVTRVAQLAGQNLFSIPRDVSQVRVDTPIPVAFCFVDVLTYPAQTTSLQIADLRRGMSELSWAPKLRGRRSTASTMLPTPPARTVIVR